MLLGVFSTKTCEMTYCTCVLSCIKDIVDLLEGKASPKVYMEETGKMEGNGVQMVRMDEPKVGGDEEVKRKKVIYFADGSTMEEDEGDGGEEVTRKVVEGVQSEPVDPSKLDWPHWMGYKASQAGNKTLHMLEGMGESAAYHLGITTPKYQSEIDEYNRMVQKKKSHEEELVSWSTGPKANDKPVIEEVKVEKVPENSEEPK